MLRIAHRSSNNYRKICSQQKEKRNDNFRVILTDIFGLNMSSRFFGYYHWVLEYIYMKCFVIVFFFQYYAAAL